MRKTIDRLNELTIVKKYAQTKRENLYNNELMNDEIKNIIITEVDNTENLFARNFLTLDEAVMRIAMAAHYALNEA